LLLVALVGCSSQKSDDEKGAEIADQAGVPVSPIRYFPPTASQPKAICFRSFGFSREAAVDGFQERWFSQHLAAAKEPSIYLAAQRAAPPGLSTFRFTWLRSFHTPVFIRVHVTGDGKYHMVAKELSGAGGYQPGTMKQTIVRDLLPGEAQQFRELIRRTNFFKLPPSDCSLGADGAEWIFEGIDRQGYHVLTRWSPEKGPARDVGEFVLKLSGWHFDEVY
jgi:hypothetical protein